MNFISIKKQENLKPEFMYLFINGKQVTDKIPVNVPLKVVFTTAVGELVEEYVLSMNKKMLKQIKKIYLLEEGTK